MGNSESTSMGFRASPLVARQIFVATEQPDVPASYRLTDLAGAWLASDRELPVVTVSDARGRKIGVLVGYAYSEWQKTFVDGDTLEAPVEVRSVGDLELKVLSRLGGMYVFLSGGELPLHLYMDHGGTFPIVYSAEDRRAASSSALLLDEADYRARFRADLHESLISREGAGGWISGSLTAHRGVRRVLPNHYLDLSDWTVRRFWPRPGDFVAWRDFDASVELAANALSDFSAAASRRFDVAVTLTAGFDSRLLVASCRASLDRCQFFTLEAPDGEMDVTVSQALAKRFGLQHRVMPLRQATEAEMATWDRMVGDCMVEAPRRTHVTLRGLTDRNAVFTGMYGEVGRCRLYRQDFDRINDETIDARFVIDRLTLPAHPELLADIAVWLAELAGQPNSVVLDLAFHELKFGSWAMGQRPISNSIKLNFLPFAQRAVLEAFIGVAPAQKKTDVLFSAIVRRLWPELMEAPINKYGDVRDHLGLWKKLTNPARVRRFLRDRLARANRARSPH